MLLLYSPLNCILDMGLKINFIIIIMLIVVMMGKWSDDSTCWVVHVLDCATFQNGRSISHPVQQLPPGPPANLRPIILLSVIRKILAICMIRRTSRKLSNKIPITQAAYRVGRSTTDNVFNFKVLAEKAITSKYYETPSSNAGYEKSIWHSP